MGEWDRILLEMCIKDALPYLEAMHEKHWLFT